MLDRRTFLAAGAGLLLAPRAGLSALASPRRPRVALLGTVIRRNSHAQHFLDRLAAGYAWGGGWQMPRLEVAALYVDQQPEGDLTNDRLQRYGLRRFPTIAETLTLGGEKLAVDGVLLIGEHGDYPTNEKGQKLYPRYRWFREIVRVFEDSGRAVPVFNDKHLSTSWDECREMVETARRLEFPFLAGSSLPVTRRLPAVDLPHGAAVTECVCVAHGGPDFYDIHALESVQCFAERRRGGETGVRRLTALRGENLWRELERDDRRVTRELFVAALARSHSLPVENGYLTAPLSYEWARAALPDTLAYLYEHRDGVRGAIFLTGIRDFNCAVRRADGDETLSCQMYLPMPGEGATSADFFNPLARQIEELMLTGRAPYPVERTLLTSGLVIAGVESLHQGQTPVDTPHLDVAYEAPEESLFWRE